jgi:hypothetical protein
MRKYIKKYIVEEVNVTEESRKSSLVWDIFFLQLFPIARRHFSEFGIPIEVGIHSILNLKENKRS